MNAYYIIYHSLIFLALVLAFISYTKGYTRAKFFIILLFITLAVELLAEILHANKMPFVWAYHGFVVIEYTLLCLYFLGAASSIKGRRVIVYSIPAFATFSIWVSYFLYAFRSFPGVNINVSGLLLFISFTYLLFNLKMDAPVFVFNHPDFWISIGILIFFGGTFLFNGVYTRLLNFDEQKAMELFGIINKPLNLLLYSCIIIGLTCSIRNKRYIIQ